VPKTSEYPTRGAYVRCHVDDPRACPRVRPLVFGVVARVGGPLPDGSPLLTITEAPDRRRSAPCGAKEPKNRHA
jgi:hypothetical protein